MLMVSAAASRPCQASVRSITDNICRFAGVHRQSQLTLAEHGPQLPWRMRLAPAGQRFHELSLRPSLRRRALAKPIVVAKRLKPR